jgi:hypothetical protein
MAWFVRISARAMRITSSVTTVMKLIPTAAGIHAVEEFAVTAFGARI